MVTTITSRHHGMPTHKITAEFPSGETAQSSSSVDGDHLSITERVMAVQFQKEVRAVDLIGNFQGSST